MSLKNKSTTLEDFENVKKIIVTKYPNFKIDNIQSIFVKTLPDADVIATNKSKNTNGKTYHIACTGESTSFFYHIFGENYFLKGNLTDSDTFDINIETKFLDNKYYTDFIKSKCSIWINQKSNQKNQIGLSKKQYDGKEFYDLREKMFKDDVLIFFKYEEDSKLENYLILLKSKEDKNLINTIFTTNKNPKYYESLSNKIDDFKDNNNSIYNNNTTLRGINKIYFGAPGTGKSKYVSDIYYNNFAKRVVFHPEYTYNDFVGYIKPKVNNDKLSYEFSPGIFTQILIDALNNPTKMHTLIIEEISRANVSCVFGDLFQLLDRDDNGNSQYRINNLDVFEYIKKILGDKYQYNDGSIGIPNNLNIIATMNTSDQNVFTMDTAFKRRWEFEYIKIEFNKNHTFKDDKIENLNITWQKFVETINEFMMSPENSDLMISEDKQIGQYFLKKDELNNPQKFGYKILLYLWDDVFKMSRESIFNNQIRTFTQLMDKFSNKNAIEVFSSQFKNRLNEELISKNIEEITNG